jgi:hypothetical protein
MSKCVQQSAAFGAKPTSTESGCCDLAQSQLAFQDVGSSHRSLGLMKMMDWAMALADAEFGPFWFLSNSHLCAAKSR